jgi:hypothetical protein
MYKHGCCVGCLSGPFRRILPKEAMMLSLESSFWLTQGLVRCQPTWRAVIAEQAPALQYVGATLQGAVCVRATAHFLRWVLLTTEPAVTTRCGVVHQFQTLKQHAFAGNIADIITKTLAESIVGRGGLHGVANSRGCQTSRGGVGPRPGRRSPAARGRRHQRAL